MYMFIAFQNSYLMFDRLSARPSPGVSVDRPAGPDLVLFTARHSCCRDKKMSGTRMREREREGGGEREGERKRESMLLQSQLCRARARARARAHAPHARTRARTARAHALHARREFLEQKWTQRLTISVSSVCWSVTAVNSVFAAQDLSDDTATQPHSLLLGGFFPELCLFHVRLQFNCCPRACPMSSVDRSFARDVGLQKPAEKREDWPGARRRRLRRSSGINFSFTAMVTAAAPEDLGLADVTMLITDTSSRHCKDSSVQLVLCR